MSSCFFFACVPRLPPYFLLPSSPWILCLPTWSRPCPPTHHSTSFSRWFSNAEKEEKKMIPRIGTKKSFLFSIVISVSFRRLCVCVCVCMLSFLNASFLSFTKKEELLLLPATTTDPPIIWFIISSHHNN